MKKLLLCLLVVGQISSAMMQTPADNVSNSRKRSPRTFLASRVPSTIPEYILERRLLKNGNVGVRKIRVEKLLREIGRQLGNDKFKNAIALQILINNLFDF